MRDTQAMVGLLARNGHLQTRPVRHHGHPGWMVPILFEVWDATFRRETSATVLALLAHSWAHLAAGQRDEGLQRQCQVGVGPFADDVADAPYEGAIGDHEPADRQWAYLVGGGRLHVYVGLDFRGARPGVWRPAACWPLAALTRVTDAELVAVQEYGDQARGPAAHGVPDDLIDACF